MVSNEPGTHPAIAEPVERENGWSSFGVAVPQIGGIREVCVA